MANNTSSSQSTLRPKYARTLTPTDLTCPNDPILPFNLKLSVMDGHLSKNKLNGVKKVEKDYKKMHTFLTVELDQTNFVLDFDVNLMK